MDKHEILFLDSVGMNEGKYIKAERVVKVGVNRNNDRTR